MPRVPRLLLDDQPTVYHVMSRTALDGFPIGAREKDYLLHCITRFSQLYFADIIGFCIMGNHFHLLLRMHSRSQVSNDEVIKRYKSLRGEDAPISPTQIEALKQQWCSLSRFMQEIKQSFSLYYNKQNNRKGYFWSDRYKSVIVEEGRTVVNCQAYIDLNPVRAGLVQRPEDYRWCSLGYHMQTGNRDALLSLNFGLHEWSITSEEESLRLYRQFLYETGALEHNGKQSISQETLEKERALGFVMPRKDRLLLRTRYFTDSSIIGSRDFVISSGRKLGLVGAEKRSPRHVDGLDAIYSYRRLSEKL